MPVIAGVGIPRTAPDMDAAKALIAHLMKPATQIATLRATNFFPVVDVALPDDLPPSVKAAGAAIAAMSSAPDANPGLLPAGLGDMGGDFNRVFVDTFERIILARQDIRTVLDDQKGRLAAIMDKTGAPCWAPDAPSEGRLPGRIIGASTLPDNVSGPAPAARTPPAPFIRRVCASEGAIP